MDTVVHFLHEERGKLREAAVDKAVADAAAAEAVHSTGTAADSSSEAAGNGMQLDYQRKVTPSERAVLLADILEDAYEAAQGGGRLLSWRIPRRAAWLTWSVGHQCRLLHNMVPGAAALAARLCWCACYSVSACNIPTGPLVCRTLL